MSYTERARALRPYIEKASVSLTDEDALQAVELFPQWVIGHAYAVDERLQYKNVLYRVVQAHISQSDWPRTLHQHCLWPFHWMNGLNLCNRLVLTMPTKRATRSHSTVSIISA